MAESIISGFNLGYISGGKWTHIGRFYNTTSACNLNQKVDPSLFIGYNFGFFIFNIHKDLNVNNGPSLTMYYGNSAAVKLCGFEYGVVPAHEAYTNSMIFSIIPSYYKPQYTEIYRIDFMLSPDASMFCYPSTGFTEFPYAYGEGLNNLTDKHISIDIYGFSV